MGVKNVHLFLTEFAAECNKANTAGKGEQIKWYKAEVSNIPDYMNVVRDRLLGGRDDAYDDNNADK